MDLANIIMEQPAAREVAEPGWSAYSLSLCCTAYPSGAYRCSSHSDQPVPLGESLLASDLSSCNFNNSGNKAG